MLNIDIQKMAYIQSEVSYACGPKMKTILRYVRRFFELQVPFYTQRGHRRNMLR